MRTENNPMMLMTQRLQLMPFTLELIAAASEGKPEAIESLGYRVVDEWPEPDLREAMPHFKTLLLANGANGFNSWVIVEKDSRQIVGSLGFLGNPDSSGAVEIGFGIVPSKRRNGYCLESIGELIEWAFRQDGVRRIKAQCENHNQASVSVLTKAGFLPAGHRDGLRQWEMRRGDKRGQSRMALP